MCALLSQNATSCECVVVVVRRSVVRCLSVRVLRRRISGLEYCWVRSWLRDARSCKYTAVVVRARLARAIFQIQQQLAGFIQCVYNGYTHTEAILRIIPIPIQNHERSLRYTWRNVCDSEAAFNIVALLGIIIAQDMDSLTHA